MKTKQISTSAVVVLQAVVIAAFVASYAMGSTITQRLFENGAIETASSIQVAIPRHTPLTIEPLYDDPQVVSDVELAAVLQKIQPRFCRKRIPLNRSEA